MRVYVLEVTENYFDYDEIDYSVVLAESEEQAIKLAKETRDVTWEVIKVMDTDRAGLVESYIHHG